VRAKKDYEAYAMKKKVDVVSVKGKKWNIYKSPRKNKQLVAVKKETKVHFGDPLMPEYPGTKRGDAYCARSKGIGNLNNPRSANFWSRKYLWNCKGKKSMKREVL